MTPECKDEKKINMEANLNKQLLHNRQPNTLEKCLLNLDAYIDEKYQDKVIIFANVLGVFFSLLLLLTTHFELLSSDVSLLMKLMPVFFWMLLLKATPTKWETHGSFSRLGRKGCYGWSYRRKFLPSFGKYQWLKARLEMFYWCLIDHFINSFIIAFSISNLVIYFSTYLVQLDKLLS